MLYLSGSEKGLQDLLFFKKSGPSLRFLFDSLMGSVVGTSDKGNAFCLEKNIFEHQLKVRIRFEGPRNASYVAIL